MPPTLEDFVVGGLYIVPYLKQGPETVPLS